MTPADTPYEESVVLIAEVYVPSVEEHGPGGSGNDGGGSSRPVGGRLHIAKGIARREIRDLQRRLSASPAERRSWELVGRGHAIRWAALGEDVPLEGLLLSN